MKRPQFRLWMWIVAVAVLALVLASIVAVRALNQALYDFYGPRGELERTNARAADTLQPRFDRDE
jgi:cytochrome c-type biogenesis protein CcmE